MKDVAKEPRCCSGKVVWLGDSPSSRLSHCSIYLVSDRSLVPTSTSPTLPPDGYGVLSVATSAIAYWEGICFSACKFGNAFLV